MVLKHNQRETSRLSVFSFVNPDITFLNSKVSKEIPNLLLVGIVGQPSYFYTPVSVIFTD